MQPSSENDQIENFQVYEINLNEIDQPLLPINQNTNVMYHMNEQFLCTFICVYSFTFLLLIGFVVFSTQLYRVLIRN